MSFAFFALNLGETFQFKFQTLGQGGSRMNFPNNVNIKRKQN